MLFDSEVEGEERGSSGEARDSVEAFVSDLEL